MSTRDHTRSSLIRRVRDPADQASWREFQELYHPVLLAYLKKQGLKDQDAHDVVQDIFLALVRALPTFELDRSRGRFRTWLWQVAWHALADWARRQRRQSKAEDEWCQHLAASCPPADREPDDEWVAAYHQRVLETVLARVRDESRPATWNCFERHVLRSRPAAEVAAELGVSATAVYTNASRILARVRDLCQEHEEELGDG
jgi:RNA polymerase sigma-70 factor (ECF subfamily)